MTVGHFVKSDQFQDTPCEDAFHDWLTTVMYGRPLVATEPDVEIPAFLCKRCGMIELPVDDQDALS